MTSILKEYRSEALKKGFSADKVDKAISLAMNENTIVQAILLAWVKSYNKECSK